MYAPPQGQGMPMQQQGGGMGMGGGMPPMSQGGGGMGMGMQQQQGQIGMGQIAGGALLGQRFRGTVKSYSDSNGYGFIGGEEVISALGKDVFLHQREITEVTGISRPQVPSGVAVTFAVTINPKGQPQARELRFEESAMLQIQQAGPSMASGQQVGGGQVAGNMLYIQNGRRFMGYIRSYSQTNGFGFIGGDDITQTFGKDVFLHFRELQQLMGGMQKPTIATGVWVTFTATMNQKGQPQARDLLFEPPTAGAPYDPNQSQAAMGASAAVAALNMQTPSFGQGGGQGQGFSTVSDADAFARVQADIERFQRQVEEQRALKEGQNEPDLKRSRRDRVKSENRDRSRSRSRPSRSPRRDD